VADVLQAMRDLELWLEAVAESLALPPNCYAAVRPANGGALKAPVLCAPNEATCLGDVDTDGGPLVVEIFQRVGSISIGAPQPGNVAEGAVAWPGLKQGALTVKASVVSVGGRAQSKTKGPSSVEKEETGLQPIPEATVPESSPVKEMAEADNNMGESVGPSKSIMPAPAPAADPVNIQVFLNNCDQIIPNLYLGGVAAVADPKLLEKQGISAVCCCLREVEFSEKEFSKAVDYYRVDVEDMSREPIELFLPEATEFIHSWISREQPVLVHCRAGVSRSASVVIAYLMTYHKFSLHDAFFLVRSRRNIVTPNLGFMEKLGDYEEEIHGTEPTIDLNKYIGWYTSPGERAAVPDLRPD